METWLTWLFRFALPEETSPNERFRHLPCVFPAWGEIPGGRWTHVVIDEAQDLAVPEASLFGSLVHPDGALTVSADFKQVVSPVHGMTDLSAFQIGKPVSGKRGLRNLSFCPKYAAKPRDRKIYRSILSKNVRQVAPFETGERFGMLSLGYSSQIQLNLHFRSGEYGQYFAESKSVATVALLQINEDEGVLIRLRMALEAEGLPLAPMWAPADNQQRLITTSVERIKGLEYDACIVLGLDNTERTLNFTKNRAYVALSRGPVGS